MHIIMHSNGAPSHYPVPVVVPAEYTGGYKSRHFVGGIIAETPQRHGQLLHWRHIRCKYLQRI